jgi:hypothetical protein
MTLRRFQVKVHERVIDWLVDESHPQQEVRTRVMTDFFRIFDMLEVAGPLISPRLAKRIRGVENLWEARVNDPTGAYRAFFGYGRANDRAVIAVAHPYRKTENQLPPRVRVTASKRVRAYLEEIDD